MTHQDDLHQILWEFVYELLPDDQMAALREQISSDPETARAYAIVRQQIDLLAKASKLEAQDVELTPPEPPVPPVDFTPVAETKPKKSLPAKNAAPNAFKGAAGTVRWLLSTAAAALFLFTTYTYYGPDSPLRESAVAVAEKRVADSLLRLRVTGPDQLQPGAGNLFSVTTSSMDGQAVAADIEYTLYSAADGQPLVGPKRVETNGAGRLEVRLPAEKVVPNSRLEVLAMHQGEHRRVSAMLEVADDHLITQLATDKPLYQPGETIYYRSLTLTRFAKEAPDYAALSFEILDPSGAPLAGSQQQGGAVRGVGSGAYALPVEAVGGGYSLVVRSLDESFPEQKREFFVRKYRLPQLEKELELGRDSYAPGDFVTADFAAHRAEGGACAEATLQVTASVDGVVVYAAAQKTDPHGGYKVEFSLPKAIEKGAGVLAVTIDDGGVRETITETIPINLGKVQVDFYPEGGDLVAGVENRIYFFSRDPLGEPVHLQGRVLDSQNRTVAELETVHEGRGAFRLMIDPQETYRVVIDSPAPAVKQLESEQPQLPQIQDDAFIVLNTGRGVFAADDSLTVQIASARPNVSLMATAVCRGAAVGQRELKTSAFAEGKKSNLDTVTIPIAAQADGVIRITVYDFSQTPPKPLAERLVYRRPARTLNIQMGGHSEGYSPGEHVSFDLLVTDETGRPQAAALGVAVVDAALLNLADDKTPVLPTQFYLTSEVESPEDLEDANFYLSDDAQAAQSLDLLLGTQGWRRFAETSLAELDSFAAAGEGNHLAAENLLAQSTPEEREQQREQLQRLLAMEGATNPPSVFDNGEELAQEYQAALAGYYVERESKRSFFATLIAASAGALLLVLLLAALLRLARGVQTWAPALVVATACLLLGVLWLDVRTDAPGQVAMNKLSDTASDEDYDQDSFTTGGAIGGGMAGMMGGMEEKMEGMMAMPMAAMAPDEKAAAVPADKYWYFLGKQQQGQEGGKDRLLRRKGKAADGFALVEAQRLGAAKKRMAGKNRFGGGMGAFGGGFGGMGDEMMGGMGMGGRDPFARTPQQLPKLPIRQYAHVHRASDDGLRSDFTQTLYWHPLLIADASGKAHVEFDLADSVTTFRVQTAAHGGGRLGADDEGLVSRIPFRIEPKLPLEVTAGDRIDLPVAINNDTQHPLNVALALQHSDLLQLAGPAQQNFQLAAAERSRAYFTFNVVGQKGQAEIVLQAKTEQPGAQQLSDAVKRSVRVTPTGFPIAQSFAGVLDGPQELEIDLPKNWIAGTLEVTLQAFPTSLADLQSGVEGILREPAGCFEQTSSSNYPNVMALQYMQQHNVSDPQFTRRAKDLLKKGYAKLTSFECSKKGYEWFGGDPGHEALTAYGLMEFQDMQQVWDVDHAMVDRTAAWLLSRRDGQGGFLRNDRALDSFGRASQEVTNAYITWALSEAGRQDIAAELKALVAAAKKSNDPYVIALSAASALNADQSIIPQQIGVDLLSRLSDLQKEDGRLEAADGTITRSGGLSMQVETTALAAIAWMKHPSGGAAAKKAVEWLTKNRQGGGGFGSTQATVLALKALVENSKANQKEVAAGALVLVRDGHELGRSEFSTGEKETILLDGIGAELTSGENKLTINLTGDNQMPYVLNVAYRSPQPANDAACAVRLSTHLAKSKLRVGDVVRLDVTLENNTDQGQPMTTAIVGLPAGLEPRAEQLEELKDAGKYDYYEVRARELIFYWRSLAPSVKGDKKISLPLELVAEIPGHYTGPASRAYLYYTAEQKQWTEPLVVEIFAQ